MKLARHFTRQIAALATKGTWTPKLVEDMFQWKEFSVSIKEGSKTLLEMAVEAPTTWLQQPVTILAHKFLRKAGVPNKVVESINNNISYPERAIPRWLLPKIPALGHKLSGEVSARQVFRRLAGHWAYTAFTEGYLDDESDAQCLYDEAFYMLANQMAAPNSPQFFNTGIWWAYGVGADDGEVEQTGYRSSGIGRYASPTYGAYQYPQTSACFILGLEDSLLGEGGILDNVAREAAIFKYGSGSGANYSSLRAKGAPLSNGGTSSGMMSFLKLFDVNAGTIKSGGTTRRAARMCVVDDDHPEALEFVTWKAREEAKVTAMVTGARTMLSNAPKDVDEITKKVVESILTAQYEGEAYTTVSGQNANNSLRCKDTFMKEVTECKRTCFGTPHHQKAGKLWDTLCHAAWSCGDPGVQFHDTINKWHTIPKFGVQRASNPCAEFLFIDDSSCNLASLNLVKFWERNIPHGHSHAEGDEHIHGVDYFDVEAFVYASQLWTLILDVSVTMSSFPDAKVAKNSVDYRAIGLGYANLGGLLMLAGVPYDSEEGRVYAGLITAVMHGAAWHKSADLAEDTKLGAFHNFAEHAEDVRRVYNLHRDEAIALNSKGAVAHVRGDYHPFHNTLNKVTELWEFDVPEKGTIRLESRPVRNAQLTLLAPTGTIGLVMGCDSTGIEPVYMLTAMKSLAGGGQLYQECALVPDALEVLGYSQVEIGEIVDYVRNTGRVNIATPHIRREHIPIFDCANDINVGGHLLMMSAVQPFLSGGISKTVNMPNSASVEDVSQAYLTAWGLGLKAVALYRDGCKLSQPLQAITPATPNAITSPVTNQQLAAQEVPSGVIASSTSSSTLKARPTVDGHPPVGVVTPRYKLPTRRGGFTQKVDIAGQSLYLRTGEYPDGRLGEIFLTIGRDGSTMKHLLDSLAICISLGLQHGVPLLEYVEAFTDSRAEPAGIVRGSDNVRMCTSIMDYLMRELGASYMHLETNIPVVVQVPEAAVVAAAPSAVVPSGKTIPIEDVTAVGANVLKLPERLVVREVSDVGIRTMARPKYTGNACTNCGEFTLRRSGTCHVCDSCGESSGCS